MRSRSRRSSPTLVSSQSPTARRPSIHCLFGAGLALAVMAIGMTGAARTGLSQTRAEIRHEQQAPSKLGDSSTRAEGASRVRIDFLLAGEDVRDQSVDLLPGESTDVTMRVGCADRLSHRADWRGGGLNITLRAPSGDVITRDVMLADPDFDYLETDRSVSCSIRCPLAGDWVFTLVVDASSGPLEAHLIVIEHGADDWTRTCGAGVAAEVSRLSVTYDQPDQFDPRTKFHVTIAGCTHTRLSIYDRRGRVVARPIDHPVGPGQYEVAWDGRSLSGGSLQSGVYTYRLESGAEVLNGRLVLLNSQYSPAVTGEEMPDPTGLLWPGPWF